MCEASGPYIFCLAAYEVTTGANCRHQHSLSFIQGRIELLPHGICESSSPLTMVTSSKSNFFNPGESYPALFTSSSAITM